MDLHRSSVGRVENGPRWQMPASMEPVLSRPAGLRPADVDESVVTLLAPESLESDRYRLLRWQIELLKSKTGASVIGVTSPGIGEGKTTTALNLAGALSLQPDARILLIDAGLRDAAAAHRLGLRDGRSEAGLAGAIFEPNRSLASVARPCPPFNLFVIPPGRVRGVPFEMLRSPRLGELLAEAKRSFDFVVVDTPPLLLLPDCRAVAQWIDGFLLVVGAHRTSRADLGTALNSLEESKVLGIVFNGEDRPPARYYRRYYTAAQGGGKP